MDAQLFAVGFEGPTGPSDELDDMERTTKIPSLDTADYELAGRELVAESDGLRVQVLTLDAGQCVPWHSHSNITDTFFCLDGPMVVATREPDIARQLSFELAVGDRFDVPPGRAHFVRGRFGRRCRFVIVQGVGAYDYVPEGLDRS